MCAFIFITTLIIATEYIPLQDNIIIMAAKQPLDIKLVTDIENILTFQMRGNRVLIKPSESVKMVGGVILPDGAADSMLAHGTVLSIGTQVSDLKIGDTVFFFKSNNEPGAIRQGTDLYFWFADYNIIAVLNTPSLTVQADGEITG